MSILIKDMYDRLAIITGFPVYTNDTDTPETNRLLLQVLSDGLLSTIDDLYTNNNVLERTNKLVTIEGQAEYGLTGIVKNIQLTGTDKNDKKVNRRIPYNDEINKDIDFSVIDKERTDIPRFYTIKNGYLKLYPIPDKDYTLILTVSTTDLVWADNDTARSYIEHINDQLMADPRFANLVILKSASLLFLRANNANAQVYDTLYQQRLRTYKEQDFGSMEARRAYRRDAGHFNTYRGLLG